MGTERAPYGQWLTGKDVRRLTVASTPIGKGSFGEVFQGRLHFNNGTTRRVAVKKFSTPLSQSDVRKYEKVIERLARAEVQIPKMGFLKHEGEWVQVSSLFGGTETGSKLSSSSNSDVESRIEALTEHVYRLHQAGFTIEDDEIHFYRTQQGVKTATVDIDIYAREPRKLSGPKLFEANAQSVARFAPRPFRRNAIQAFLDKFNITPEKKREIIRKIISDDGKMINFFGTE